MTDVALNETYWHPKEFLGRLPEKMNLLGMIVLGIMPLPIVVDVIRRFLVGRSISGIIEIEEFMLVLIVFLSLASTQMANENISIDLFYNKLSDRRKAAIDAFNSLTCFLLGAVLTWRLTVNAISKLPNRSFSLSIPVSPFVFIAAFGSLVLTLILLTQVFECASRMFKNRMIFNFFVALAACLLLYAAPFIIKQLPFDLSGIFLGACGFVFLFILILLHMPIGFAMAITGLLGLLVTNRTMWAALSTVGTSPYATTASFILAVAPLFIIMGELAFQAGISEELFETANKWLGRLPGGLAMSAIAGCAGFAAVCGDSMSTAVTMGTVSLPEMEKKKYSPSLATGSLAAGGTLGILIPPSVGFIFYAIVTEVSIGKLFIAGIIPGLLLAFLFLLHIYIIARIRPEIAPKGEATTFREKIVSLKGVIGMLFLFVLVLGGIMAGIFSPTEGGAIGAAGAFLLAVVKRRMNLQVLIRALKDTTMITSKLLLILIGVGILGYFLAATRLPYELSDFITGMDVNRYVVFAMVILMFIVLGCLMNVIPMLLLTLPAIFPSIEAMGFDPIWFGVVSVLVMEMGQITPPIGVNVFAIGSVAKDVPMESIFKGIIPFFLCMIICILLLVIFPDIALFLPRILF